MSARPQNEAPPIQSPVFFSFGFRPFFLAAGAYAVLGIPAWLWIRATGNSPLRELPPQFWHGHEIVFGFVVAAIAGFLLTAVPNWTGAPRVAGRPLMLLASLWLAGRIAFAVAAVLPLTVLVVCEVAFLPLLIAMVAPPLLRARNRNTIVLLVLTAIWLTDAVFMYSTASANPLLARSALLVAIDIVLLLITVIGGRIVPAFTASALRARGNPSDVRSNGWLDGLAIAPMAAIVILDVAGAPHRIAAALVGFAAIMQAWRFIGWKTLHALDLPLVWSLHLGYAWLPVGLAMKAVYLWSGASWSTYWLHALTIGTAASMILAVMTRAALGHTGRKLIAARPIAIAYVLLSLAAVFRALAPVLLPMHYAGILILSAALWVGAFSLFLATYTHILTRPRIEGSS